MKELFAYAIFDVTDWDEDLAFLMGGMHGARIPYVKVRKSESDTMAQRQNLNESNVIPYHEITNLFHPNSVLHERILQAISPARILEELIYELWFPRHTTAIWVVCPQCHDPGEFAKPSNPDYTYLDNLGDTDALLEIMVFLSRYYPKASIDKISSDHLPPGHTKSNLVVIGGPGSCEDIGNRVCLDMMEIMKSRVSYSEDCESMLVTLDATEPIELRAEMRPDIPNSASADYFSVRRDHGYFARFPNPLNKSATVILVNGIHTAGVLGAAKAFGHQEALRNYHSVFNWGANPGSFECYFEVEVINGEVSVPNIPNENIYSIGPMKPSLPDARTHVRECLLENMPHPVVVLFIAGDRGGGQRNQIQTPRECTSIKEAIRGSEHRDAFKLAFPIMAATYQDLAAAHRDRPAILHFAGHGDNRSLSFILDQGLLANNTPLIPEQLAAILTSFPDRIRLCVFNTCDSAAIAKYLVNADVVDAAIGWPTKLDDAAAIAFSQTLYGSLGDGLALLQSVTLANESCGSKEPALLFTNTNVDSNVFTFVERTQE
ncbi:MAG: hypothetical protein WBV94_05055 [Blastocatellia bacterium]